MDDKIKELYNKGVTLDEIQEAFQQLKSKESTKKLDEARYKWAIAFLDYITILNDIPRKVWSAEEIGLLIEVIKMAEIEAKSKKNKKSDTTKQVKDMLKDFL